jgi:tripartite-type tricarboxylate transporter receptor subunit TctC
LGLALICFSTRVNSRTYPAKPFRLFVGYPPGGSGGFTTRVIADARANPGRLFLASAGVGSAPHLAGVGFEAAAKGLAKPEIRDRIALQGMDAAPSASPEAFAAEIKAEAPMWERVIRAPGAKAE